MLFELGALSQPAASPLGLASTCGGPPWAEQLLWVPHVSEGCGSAVPAPTPEPILCAPSTVLLLNPVEVQAEFLAVANKLSTPGHSPHSAYTTLLLHAFQATFGAHCDLPGLHGQLQVRASGPRALASP